MFRANPFEQAGSSHSTEEEHSERWVDVITDLKHLVAGLRGGYVDAAGGSSEAKLILAGAHPDRNPGDTYAERIAKIAAQVLDGYKGKREFREREIGLMLDQLEALETELRPAPPLSEPPISSVGPRSRRISGAREKPVAEQKKKFDWDVEHFEFMKWEWVDKEIFQVEVDYTGEELSKIIGDTLGWRPSPQALGLFEIEGVDGVLVAKGYSPNERRTKFDDWVLIKELPHRRLKSLGRFEAARRYNKTSGELGGFDRGQRIMTDRASIDVGEEELDPNSSRAYCRVRMRPKRDGIS